MKVQREYKKKKCVHESAECRENRLTNERVHQEEKRANESPQCREKRLAKQRQYDQRDHGNVANEIRKFHTAVSSGPLYICSCINKALLLL